MSRKYQQLFLCFCSVNASEEKPTLGRLMNNGEKD